MRTLLSPLRQWIARGDRFSLATVIHVEGSAPRAPGECLIIASDGLHFAGAVSSGCLENEVLEASHEVLKNGKGLMLHFGPDGVFPWRDGLSCGGQITVSVEPWWGCSSEAAVREIAALVMACLEEDAGCFVLSRGDSHYGEDCGGRAAGQRDRFTSEEIALAREGLISGRESHHMGLGAQAVFIRLIHPRRKLLLVGAVDLAVRITPLAHCAGYKTLVLDPRRAYADDERFTEPPDTLLCGWPAEFIEGLKLGRRDAALLLSHDPKIDDPAIIELLKVDVGYIGALGSVTSHTKRLQRLREAGQLDAKLARIEGPAGIKLGVDASSVAMGIMAGVVRAAGRLPGK